MASQVTLLAAVFLGIAAVIEASHITIKSGGYEGIVIAFSPDVKEAKGVPLIPKIKELFTQGSRALYNATRTRSYFKEVTILVPRDWTRKPEYKRATFETFMDGDIRIDSPNPTYGDGPYTLQVYPCGYPGMYIHLTPNYLEYLSDNSTTLFGDPGKTLVHEWAHLRYGIFDEFGYKDVPGLPLFYYDSNVKAVRPNACTNQELPGRYWDPITDSQCKFNGDMPEDHCIYIPDLEENEATSSIASYHFLPHVHTFCDDTSHYVHNKRAPNKHNLLCNGRSTWSVITEHEDFKNNKNPPTVVSNTVPTFHIVQEMEETYAVVLDVSTSMNAPYPYTKLHMLQDVLTRWLREEVPLGTAIALSTFSTNVGHQGIMRRIQTNSEREQLIREIPPKASGMTCIGCGLRAGARQLLDYRKEHGGTIILLTDGEENQFPYIVNVQPELINAKIRVITIAFTDAASDNIEKLAAATGGKAYFVPLTAGIQELGSAFFDAITVQSQDVADLPVKIKDERYTGTNTLIEDTFSIDRTLGKDIVVNFIFTQENDIQDIEIRGPGTSVSMHHPNANVQKNKKNIQFSFSTLQTGKYEYRIARRGVTNQEIIVTVTSKSQGNGIKPIITTCFSRLEKKNGQTVLAVFAEVKQGNNPVIGATVVARVDRPNNKPPSTFNLLDNGNGDPDITGKDGIYSRYFTKFSGKGRYSIKAQVAGTGKTSIQEVGFIASQSMPVVNKYMASLNVSLNPTGDFERTATGGTINLEENINSETMDIFPPNKVQDLRVTNISLEDFTVVLQWTAPGDDLDSGTAWGYDFRCSSSWDALFDSFNGSVVLLSNTSTPSPSGTEETLLVQVDGAKPEETYFFAMKAFDDAGHESSVSNIAQATFPKNPRKPGFLEWLLEQILGALGSIFGREHLPNISFN